MSDTSYAGSTYEDGRRAGLAVAAFALAITAFVNLLGLEKSLLAGVLAILALQGRMPGVPAFQPMNISAPAPPASNCSNRSTPPPTSLPPISEAGRRRGATSTASSGSPTTSTRSLSIQGRAFRSASPPRFGDPLPHSARVRTRGRKSGMAPVETASLPWSNSANACARWP